MREGVIFVAKYYFILIALSVLYKILFLCVTSTGESISVADCLNVLFYGLQHDFAIAGYFTVVPLVTTLVSLFAKIPTRTISLVYNSIVAFLFTLAFLADITLYPYWGFKLDASVLMYLDSPANAFASVEVWHFILLTFLLCGGTYGTYRLLKKCCTVNIPAADTGTKKSKWGSLGIYTLIGALMFLGIRGGIAESTNNVGTVYYSNRQILNHSAVNPLFSFLYSLGKMEDFTKEYAFFDNNESKRIVDELYTQDSQITDTLLNNTRPNVITIILEGMSAELIGTLDGMTGVTPNFDKLAEEGVLFTNCHANSYRTDRGLICILSGYPSFPKTSVMKAATKSQQLPSLASSLGEAGYNSTFIYGGDINFTNMKGYLYSTGYSKTIADNDFTAEERASHRWGVGDDVTFDKLFNTIMEQDSEPWNITYLTLSSHEPWTVPYNRIKDDEIANSFAFTDEELGKFVSRLKETDKWDNTLIICISDHTLARYPKESKQSDINHNRIAFLLIGGAIKESKRIDKLCNQTDLAATILAQLELPIDKFTFSRNILSPNYDYPFAYHSFNNGISFIDSTGITLYDLDSHSITFSTPGDGNDDRLMRAKAILQTTYSDFYTK